MHRSSSTERSISILVLTVSLIALLLFIAHFYDFTVDDAFISLRYARNLSSGNGLVFNIGERVEGYTNFLWIIIVSLFIRLGADPVVTAKILGVIFSLGTLYLLWSLSPIFLPGKPWLRNVPALLMVTTASFSIYAVSGLETIMFCFLLTLAFKFFIREETAIGSFQISWIILFLLTLTRPEGFLFFIIFAVVKFSTKTNRRRLIAWASPYLLLLAVYLIWKLTYFGNILPNTFYAKTGRGLVQYAGGLFYTYAYFKSHGGIILLLLIFLPLFYLVKRDYGAKKPVALLIVSVVLWILYSIYKGHDPLPSFRFFVLILPFIYLLVTIGLGIFHEAVVYLAARTRWPGFSANAIISMIVGLLIFNNFLIAYLSTNDHPKLREYQIQINEMNVNLEFAPAGKLLKQIAPPDAKIAVIDAGAIPYYSELYTIDRWGLIDPHIARTKKKGPLGEKFDADYILERKPEFIQTKMYRSRYNKLINKDKVTASDFIWPGDMYLFRNPVFRSDYEICKEAALDAIFIRKDLLSSVDG